MTNSQTLKPYALHWFRRDLRLEGNQILQENLEHYQGRVIGVFCFDRVFLSRPDFSWNRFLFFLKTLEQLKKQIESTGGTLIILEQGPREAFPKLLSELKQSVGLPATITWNRDYEPFARHRDSAMEDLFKNEFKIEPRTARDHLLIEPNELSKGTSIEEGVYQVFTPFKKKWLKLFETPEVQQRMKAVVEGLKNKPLPFSMTVQTRESSDAILKSFFNDTIPNTHIAMPKVGFEVALNQTLFFGKKKIGAYPVARDLPSVSGTSQLSIYFKNGTITVPQVVALLRLKPNDKFFDELIWREFYYHILFHFPYVETGCFNKKYDALKWENKKKWFESWCKGETGFPIVDAGMRQLNATGWMHNRVRMIVASFMTKDLLIDWRWGERYFMEKLLDGDLAPNNGGWQWGASTGCDAQPYFRIFNPTLQGERFDPKGEYILKWVPELASRKDGLKIYEPHHPIIDHAEQKVKAIALFKDLK